MSSPAEFVGPYQLLTRIGEGGMGVVHLALDAHGRAVAVKVIRPHIAADTAGRERLAREVRAMSRVRGAHVAEVLDADVDAELPYVVTRYVPGRPLDTLIADHGPLPVSDLLRIGHGLADALACMHHAGVVHRDLKPSNVLLADGVPVVIDFGIAQLADESRLTSTGLFLGTPGYFAAEVARGQPASPASDISSWAATLVYAAVGHSPYGSGPLEVVLDNVATASVDLRGVPEEIVDLVRAGLDSRPRFRPSAADLAAELESRLAQLPPDTGPRSPAVDLRTGDAAPNRADAGQPDSDSAERDRFADPGTRAFTEAGQVRTPFGPVATASATELAPPWDDPAWGQRRLLTGVPAHHERSAAPAESPRTEAPGRRARGGALIGAGFLALLAAGTAVVPLMGLVAVALVCIALRTGDGVGRRMDRRRTASGRRTGDRAVAVPWHLVVAIIFTMAGFIVSGLVAGICGGITVLAARGAFANSLDAGLAVGAVVFALAAWLGPGSRGVRSGNARLATRIGPSGSIVVGVVLLVVALGASAVAYTTPADWWPTSRSAVQHNLDSVLPKLR